MTRLSDPSALRTAIILLDRPEVGSDGYGEHERLPSRLRVRATVVGHGPIACTIDVAAVRALAGRDKPTWSDLESVWQTLATSIDAKIRAGQVAGRSSDHDDPSVHIAPQDVTPRSAT